MPKWHYHRIYGANSSLGIRKKSLELPPFTHQLVKELKGIGKKCKLVLHRAPFEKQYNWKVLLMTMASVLLECFMY